MQWNSQDKVDLKRHLKERDHCCQWLVKWSAALVLLLSRNRQRRCVACDILNFTLDTKNVQLLYHGLIIFVHYGWSNSCRNTDPSASGEFFFMFFMTVFMVYFPIGVFLYQMKMKPACRWQWGKTDCNSSFRLVASQISFEQRDGTPSLILCGKHFGGDRGLVWFSR